MAAERDIRRGCPRRPLRDEEDTFWDGCKCNQLAEMYAEIDDLEMCAGEDRVTIDEIKHDLQQEPGTVRGRRRSIRIGGVTIADTGSEHRLYESDLAEKRRRKSVSVRLTSKLQAGERSLEMETSRTEKGGKTRSGVPGGVGMDGYESNMEETNT